MTTNRWTVDDNGALWWLDDNHGIAVASVDAVEHHPDTGAAKYEPAQSVAAALNGGHPDPATTQPTAEAVLDALPWHDKGSERLYDVMDVLETVRALRAAPATTEPTISNQHNTQGEGNANQPAQPGSGEHAPAASGDNPRAGATRLRPQQDRRGRDRGRPVEADRGLTPAPGTPGISGGAGSTGELRDRVTDVTCEQIRDWLYAHVEMEYWGNARLWDIDQVLAALAALTRDAADTTSEDQP